MYECICSRLVVEKNFNIKLYIFYSQFRIMIVWKYRRNRNYGCKYKYLMINLNFFDFQILINFL